MLHYTTTNSDAVISYLDGIVAQGKAKSGIHLERATSRDPWTININNRAFYMSYEVYDRLRAVIATSEVWK